MVFSWLPLGFCQMHGCFALREPYGSIINTLVNKKPAICDVNDLMNEAQRGATVNCEERD